MRGNRHRWQMALAAVVVAASPLALPAEACSIPVFRYALERWPADLFVATASVPAVATAAEKQAITWLEDQAQPNGGLLNLAVKRTPATDDATAADRGSLVIARQRRGSEPAVLWSGGLAEAEATLATTPWQRELVRRLASGDAVVWVVLEGADPAAAAKAHQLLQDELPQLAEDTVLPRGIGLPGSELLADIPLEIRFSVLTVPADAAGETLLRATLLAGGKETTPEGEAIDPQAALVAAVFGRGRAAVVLPAATLTVDSVAEFTAFLCGACSCQVKQLNPGFDLLLPVDWERLLFGEGLAALPRLPAEPAAASQPELVPIPAGRSRSRAETSRARP